MSHSRIVYYAAASADGFIAAADGSVGWLDPFNSPELGYEAFLARVGGVVLGRATYDQGLSFGAWPYSGRPGLIVTSRPVGELPAKVSAISAAALPAALRELRANAAGDIWIVGGGRTARACLPFIDELELYVVPLLLGNGIPLFARVDARTPLRLLESRTFPNGIVMLRYAVVGTRAA